MKLPAAKPGERLRVNNKLIPYSFWPTKLGPKGNASLQTLLFSLDPWAIIDQTIKASCPSAAKAEALACTYQARDFYEGATDTQRVSARPLTLYYCFMNLVKAFCLTRGTKPTFDKAQHGLSEMLRGPSNRELADAFLRAFPRPNAGGCSRTFRSSCWPSQGQDCQHSRTMIFRSCCRKFCRGIGCGPTQRTRKSALLRSTISAPLWTRLRANSG